MAAAISNQPRAARYFVLAAAALAAVAVLCAGAASA